MDSQQSSQKTTERSHGLQNSQKTPGFRPKSLSESSGNHRDCAYRLQINWTRTSLNRHAWKLVDLDSLSEVSSIFWQCALGLQKLPDVADVD